MDVVFHLAAQTAVTASIKDPQRDFQTNVVGTFNLLESIRINNPKAILVYASTNKVYGPQGRALDFETPYGCSKGAGDQYVLDYCRTYDLKTVVFRQSCIYGPHQFGNEDQGWVAWFVTAALQNKKITIYGDGKQIRDILYVDDLFAAWDTAVRKINQVKGLAFDIGGGVKNKISLLELVAILEKELGRKIKIKFAPKRLGDQDIFVSDNLLAKKLLGFKPKKRKEALLLRPLLRKIFLGSP